MKFKTITIVGLGLMGGSLAAACRKRFPSSRILGVSRNPRAVRFALRKKWIHQGGPDLRKAVQVSDLVVLCTPVDTLKFLLRKIEAAARRGTLVTDVGSVKGEISTWAARKKFKKIFFVGAHPMAGSHARGIEASDPKLYEAHLTFISAPKKNRGIAAVKSFWKKISGRIFEISPDRHDRIAAEISHLPHAAAVCLVAAADPRALPFSAKGFLDSTRIAQADASVWVPIFLSNRKMLKPVFRKFEREFKAFERLVLSGNAKKLAGILKKVAAKRAVLDLR